MGFASHDIPPVKLGDDIPLKQDFPKSFPKEFQQSDIDFESLPKGFSKEIFVGMAAIQFAVLAFTVGTMMNWAPSILLWNIKIKHNALQKRADDFRFVLSREQRDTFDKIYQPEDITNLPLYLQLSGLAAGFVPPVNGVAIGCIVGYQVIEWSVALYQAMQLQSVQEKNEELFNRAVKAVMDRDLD